VLDGLLRLPTNQVGVGWESAGQLRSERATEEAKAARER
jgi:hypothetical protein